jgi:hypothetical protein
MHLLEQILLTQNIAFVRTKAIINNDNRFYTYSLALLFALLYSKARLHNGI